MKRRMNAVSLTLILVFLILGCVPMKPPPNYYMLDPKLESELIGREHGMAIGVGPLSVASHLNRLTIVTRDSNTRLTLSEANQWAEPLREGIFKVIAISLAAELDTNRIYEVPQRRKRPLDYQVAIHILRLDGELKGEVVLMARWILSSGDGKNRKELVNRVSRIVEAAEAPGYEAFVEAQSRAIAALSKEIADRSHHLDVAGAANAVHLGAHCLGDLHGKGTDATGGAIDQHFLSGLNLPLITQTL